MSRIRTIKPDAFKSESLSAVPRGVRWTFAGLWTYVDDAGRGRADARLIRAELYPLDDGVTVAMVRDDLDELAEAGCLHTFMSGGKEWFHIPAFLLHQKINRPTKPTSPTCPCEGHGPLTDHSSEPSHDSLHEDSLSVQRGKGREGKGIGKGGGTRDSVAAATRPPRNCPKHPNGTDEPCGKCADARKAHDAWQPPTPTPPALTCEHGNRPASCEQCLALAAPPPQGWRPTRSAS